MALGSPTSRHKKVIQRLNWTLRDGRGNTFARMKCLKCQIELSLGARAVPQVNTAHIVSIRGVRWNNRVHRWLAIQDCRPPLQNLAAEKSLGGVRPSRNRREKRLPQRHRLGTITCPHTILRANHHRTVRPQHEIK